jgi:hypothetical protein
VASRFHPAIIGGKNKKKCERKKNEKSEKKLKMKKKIKLLPPADHTVQL